MPVHTDSLCKLWFKELHNTGGEADARVGEVLTYSAWKRGKGVTQLPFRRNDLGVTATGQRSGLTQLWRSVFQTPTLSNAALCISGFRFPVAVVCVCGWVGCWQLLKRDLFWLYQKGDSQPAARRQSFGVQCIKCGESVWFTAMSHDFKGQIRTQFMRVCFSF